MFCNNCGTVVADGVPFCPNCGATMQQPAQPTYQQPVAPQPQVQPQATYSQPTYQQPVAPQPQTAYSQPTYQQPVAPQPQPAPQPAYSQPVYQQPTPQPQPQPQTAYSQSVYQQPAAQPQATYNQPLYGQVDGVDAINPSTILTLGIVGLAVASFGAPGIIVSAIGLSKAKKYMAANPYPETKAKVGRGLAIGGLAYGCVMTAIWLIEVFCWACVACVDALYY